MPLKSLTINGFKSFADKTRRMTVATGKGLSFFNKNSAIINIRRKI